jgi:hypothetical protein
MNPDFTPGQDSSNSSSVVNSHITVWRQEDSLGQGDVLKDVDIATAAQGEVPQHVIEGDATDELHSAGTKVEAAPHVALNDPLNFRC